MKYSTTKNKLKKLWTGTNRLDNNIVHEKTKNKSYKKIKYNTNYIFKYIEEIKTDWELLTVDKDNGIYYKTKNITLHNVPTVYLPFLRIQPLLYTYEDIAIANYYFNYTIDIENQSYRGDYFPYIIVRAGIKLVPSGEIKTEVEWKLLLSIINPLQ